MGEMHKPNLALTNILIKDTLCCVKMDLSEIENGEERFSLIVFRAYVVLSYALSLRGLKGLMLNLSSLSKVIDERSKYLVIGLKGKIK